MNVNVLLTLTFVKKSFLDFVATGGIVFHKHMFFFSFYSLPLLFHCELGLNVICYEKFAVSIGHRF